MDTVMKIARNIASKGPDAISKVKNVVRLGREMSRSYGENLEAEEFGSLFGEGNQGREGMQAFLEKRKPNW
jgi:enoyl-CoA hydratase